jgi:hypothetical protein
MMAGQSIVGIWVNLTSARTGMSLDSELSHESYCLDDRLVYTVTGGFPRLIPSNVPLGIGAVTYEISGPPLEAFRVSWGELVGAFNG